MKFHTTSEYDVQLAHRTTLVVSLLQGVLGVFLLIGTMAPFFHTAMAATLLATLFFTRLCWHKRTFRVFTRILTAVPLVFAATLVADLILCLRDSLATQGWAQTLCVISGVMLAYLLPGATYVAIKGGRYDKGVACFLSLWQVGSTAVAVFCQPVQYTLLWSWDNDIVRYVWFALVTAAAILVWLCAFMRVTTHKKAT